MRKLIARIQTLFQVTSAHERDYRPQVTLVSVVVIFLASLLVFLGLHFLLDKIIGCVPEEICGPRGRGVSLTACFWISVVVGLFALYRLGKWFILDSIRLVPSDPPSKALLTFFNKRLKIVIAEGWRWFPLYSLQVFGKMPVNVTKVNQDVQMRVKTPDTVDLDVIVGITWMPGGDRNEADLLINYLNNGGGLGVARILEDIAKDRLRIWAFSSEEGPANWQEAVGAKDDAIARLVKEILGEEIPSIPGSIPTEVLMRKYSIPERPPLEFQKARWGKQNPDGSQWERLEDELNALSREEKEALEAAIRDRQEIITKARRGNGVFTKTTLGITINRITINQVEPTGKMVEAIEKKGIEREEAEAERIQLENFTKRVQELRGLDYSLDKATELALLEQGKVVKTVRENQYTGLGEEKPQKHLIIR